MWAEWLHYGLQTNEDRLEAITILNPWFTGAFAEAEAVLVKAEAHEFEGSHEELEVLLDKQGAMMSHMMSNWEKSEVMLMIFHDEAN